MILRRDDIAGFVANWDDKAENLRAIARRLNIGLDSLVFVDDNPVERARIRDALPMVAVPELPEDAAHYVAMPRRCRLFRGGQLHGRGSAPRRAVAANAERDGLLAIRQPHG